jgi:anaerobic magnesium-protoporphyrin IX monomethyl ester cyclase
VRVTLVSLDNCVVSFGVRYLSSLLKAAGHETQLLFLPMDFNYRTTGRDREVITDFVASTAPDLVGFSLMSGHRQRAEELTAHWKERSGVPVIWGGIHPTVDPEGSLEVADMVCVGEGEEALVELCAILAGGADYRAIPSIWVRENGTLHRNPARPRLENLDTLPFPDYCPQTHFVYRGEQDEAVLPLDNAQLAVNYPGMIGLHYVISSRGCPYSCTYCTNSWLNANTQGSNVRPRAVEPVIRECEQVLRDLPYVETLLFMDDSFLHHPLSWMEEFREKYLARVNRPFMCWAAPQSVKEQKLDLLVEAGLMSLHVGFQSGSENINFNLYDRRVTNKKFLEVMELLEKYRGRILDRRVDVITDNPYATEQDQAETVRVLLQIRKPFVLGMTRLTFFPRTELSRRAREDGISEERLNEVFVREFWEYEPSFMNRLTRVTPFWPAPLVRLFLGNRDRPGVRTLFLVFYFTFYAIRNRLYVPLWNRWAVWRTRQLARKARTPEELARVTALRVLTIQHS